jgi:carboxylate-amine ligase
MSTGRSASTRAIPGCLARLAFSHRDLPAPSVGVEEELLLVEPESSAPAPIAHDVLRLHAGDDRFAPELRSSQIELVTPVCISPSDAEREIRSARADLARAVAGRARPVAVGAHPTAAEPGPIFDLPRYRAVTAQAPLAARELLTCGMHVHVGVGDAVASLAVYDGMRTHLPLLGALGANSPFHRGSDSGVASIRARLNTTLPRSGVPPAFASWDDYEEFLRWGAADQLISDASYHWYDLRLNPRQGTVELRVFDAQTDPADAAALAALTQALASWLLARHEAGEPMDLIPTHRIAESAWLAARDGTAGALVDLHTGERVPTTDLVERLLVLVAPLACPTDADRMITRVRGLARRCGAERQRLLAAGTDLEGLVDALATRTVDLRAAASRARLPHRTARKEHA